MPDLLDRLLADLPHRYKGPGGAVAVLRAGEVIVRHAWGYANAERRIPFTPATLVRMCSVTKQFTCALVLDTVADPAVLDPYVARHLPLLQSPPPGALHLCHNQSGLRDYWAVAMLHGAPAESSFGDQEAARVIRGTRTLQFTPGTRFSYVNQNFRILSDILQERTGRGFAELLRSRIFEPTGMASAFLAADTRAMPDGTEGYEGTQATGFRTAENRIVWTGDAGLGASLDDMIAWDGHIDATRDDPCSLYQRLAAPVTFSDGAAARYGFGLGRRIERDRAVTGHGGALRGWRTHRLYAAKDRVSVIVLFNHSADAHAAATDLLGAALGLDPPSDPPPSPQPDWLGAYIEPETGLSVRVAAAGGDVSLRFGQGPELLPLQPDGSAGLSGTILRHEADGLWMDRPGDNQRSRLRPLAGIPDPDITGHFHCAEIDADLTVTGCPGALYGGFSGMLGAGRMELLEPVGADTWLLPCPRALDVAPPGDWTLAFRRDGAAQVDSVTVGCWLARGLDYRRTR